MDIDFFHINIIVFSYFLKKLTCLFRVCLVLSGDVSSLSCIVLPCLVTPPPRPKSYTNSSASTSSTIIASSKVESCSTDDNSCPIQFPPFQMGPRSCLVLCLSCLRVLSCLAFSFFRGCLVIMRPNVLRCLVLCSLVLS